MSAAALARLRERAAAGVKKYRLPLLILVAGVALMLLPTGNADTTRTEPAQTQQSLFSPDEVRTQLEALLAQIDGAGRVELLLTLASAERTVYQMDARTVSSASGTTTEQQTVFQQSSSSQKLPVAQQVYGPEYQGALVVCDGADRAAVRQAIKEAVSSLTGLGSNHIAVIKMKGQ